MGNRFRAAEVVEWPGRFVGHGDADEPPPQRRICPCQRARRRDRRLPRRHQLHRRDTPPREDAVEKRIHPRGRFIAYHRGQLAVHQELSVLVRNAAQDLRIGLADEEPTRWIGLVFGDAEQHHDLGVEHQTMSGERFQKRVMIRCDRIEGDARGTRIVKYGRTYERADPCSRSRALRLLRDGHDCLVERWIVFAKERQIGRDGDVFVRIVEAGDDRPAAGIDDRGVRVGEAAQRVVRAHGGNALAADGDGFGRRQFGIGGEHCAVAEQRIHAGGAAAQGGGYTRYDLIDPHRAVTIPVAGRARHTRRLSERRPD
jgi:hypothetical protein